MAKSKSKEDQEREAADEKAQADKQAQDQARKQHQAQEARAHGKGTEGDEEKMTDRGREGETPEARAEREADAKEQEQERARSQEQRADRGDKAPDQPPPGTDGTTAPKLREQAQAFRGQEGTAPEPGREGGASGGPQGMDDLTEEERKQVLSYAHLLRSRRSGEPSPGGIDPFATPEDRGGPPKMSPEEMARGRQDAAQARQSPAQGPSGETDPRSIPTLAREQGDPSRAAYGAMAKEGEQPPQIDPERVPTEGEIAANVAVLHTKGDTSPMHPMYRAEAVNMPMGRAQARGEGEKPPRMFRVVSGQVGATAAPDRGGPNRALTLEELGIPESSIPRLISRGVIVEDEPR